MKTICCLGDSLTEGDYGIFGKSGIANVQPEGNTKIRDIKYNLV